MPYKDKGQQREAVKKAVDKHRKGITEQGITQEGITEDGTFFRDGVEMVAASYVEGLNGLYQSLPERPRFLTLSDGQVLDRANQPEAIPQSGGFINRMRACNECYNYHPAEGTLTQELKAKLS